MKKFFVSICCILILSLPAAVFAVNVGDQLPSFSGEDMNGKPVNLGAVIGRSPVVLIFWASWCANCKAEIPKINELVEQYQKRGLKFVAVNVGMNDTEEKALQYIKDYKMTYPVVFDKTGVLSEKYQIPKVLTVLVARKDGKVVMKLLNAPEIDEMNFRGLLQLPPTAEELKADFPAPVIE